MTAPERIWAWDDPLCPWKTAWDADDEEAPSRAVAYVRADLLARETARADAAEAECARLRMILAARDAYDRGEPSTPPVTGMTPTALTTGDSDE